MANEAVQVEGPYVAHDFTVAEDAGIPQYTLCGLTDPRTAAASAADEAFAGIAATEKVADNGKTELGLFTEGIFLLTTTGPAITAGDTVSLSGANLIKEATEAEVQQGKAVGKALQTSTAGSDTIEVQIGRV